MARTTKYAVLIFPDDEIHPVGGVRGVGKSKEEALENAKAGLDWGGVRFEGTRVEVQGGGKYEFVVYECSSFLYQEVKTFGTDSGVDESGNFLRTIKEVSISRVVAYLWDAELRDYGTQSAASREGHIFEELVWVDNWLTGASAMPSDYVAEE